MPQDSHPDNAVTHATMDDVVAIIRAHEVWELKPIFDAGFDVETRDADGRTALMWAAFAGTQPGLRMLLERNADVNAVDKRGNTALMLAASDPFSFRGRIAEILIEAGADPDAHNIAGESVKEVALNNHRDDVIAVVDAAKKARAEKKRLADEAAFQADARARQSARMAKLRRLAPRIVPGGRA